MKSLTKSLLILASSFLLTGCFEGKQGIQGETGPQGTQGETGPQGEQGPKGNNGKSAYEIYCENHPGYTKSEQEWIDEFCKKDETDYSKYDDFEFSPVTYGGVKGYNASYIGKGGLVYVPETFNNEPILGFKFGFNDIHEILEEDPGYRIDQIELSKNVKYVALNGNSEYALHCLQDTVFIFNGSIDELVYSNYYFEEICFNGSYEELQNTNLIEKLPITNIYTKNTEGDYVKTVNNGDIFLAEYQIISESVETLRNQFLPDMMTKFDDGFIEIPEEILVTYVQNTLQIPVKLIVNDSSEACHSNKNKLTYAASKIANDKGKEVFLVEFVFEFLGQEYVGASSTIIISRLPNKFRAFDLSFDLVKYQEVEASYVGDSYSKSYTVNFVKGSNQIKGYYSGEYGTFETAMPELTLDNSTGGFQISYNADDKCFNCEEAGEYSLFFHYDCSENKYEFRPTPLKTLETKTFQFICEMLQDMYVAHGNDIYPKSYQIISFPSTIEVTFEGVKHIGTLELNNGSQCLNIVGTSITFDIGEDYSMFGSCFYLVTYAKEDTRCSSLIRFKITK